MMMQEGQYSDFPYAQYFYVNALCTWLQGLPIIAHYLKWHLEEFVSFLGKF